MIKPETGHIVKNNRTYSPDRLKERITTQVKGLFEKYGVKPEDVGFKPDTFRRLCKGTRDWNVRHFARVIGYLKAEKGIRIDLHLNGGKEDDGMSEWKTLYEQSQKIIKQQEVASQKMVEKIEELEKIIRNP